MQRTLLALQPQVLRTRTEYLAMLADLPPSMRAIRSIYGRFFPSLTFLDDRWAASRVNAIFPDEEKHKAYFDAAFGAYLRFCDVYVRVFALLGTKYHIAISRLQTWRSAPSPGGEIAERLAEHLMLLVGLGRADLDGELVRCFLSETDDHLRAHAISFVGRSIEAQEEPVPQEVLDRFRRYWNLRLESTLPRAADHSEELASFGWWFVASAWDLDWTLTELLKVLAAIGRIEPDHLTLTALASAADTRPALAVACLAEMMNPPFREWLPMSHDEINHVLTVALGSGDQSAQTTAKETINRLAAVGFVEYRTLLA